MRPLYLDLPPVNLARFYDREVTVYLDQDGPLADFGRACEVQGLRPEDAKMRRGFYEHLPVTPGAVAAVRELVAFPHVHVFVATKIPNQNPYAATEKLLWLHRELPELEERIIITPNKACLGKPEDFLVDDRAHMADASFFPGTFIHFQTPRFPDWPAVMQHLSRALARSFSAPSPISRALP